MTRTTAPTRERPVPAQAESPRPEPAHELAKPPLTKIIATIGPATSEPGILGKLISAGVSVFRLNFSHGSLEEHAERVRMIRDAATEFGRPVAILGDLQGPRIRIGRVAGDGVEVDTGAAVVFQRGDIVAQPSASGAFRFSTTYPGFNDEVQPGQRILINEGEVRMLAVKKAGDAIEATVTAGGRIASGKGINLPDTKLSIPSLGQSDLRHVEWSLRHDLDFLAMSFVRSGEDVARLRQTIADTCRQLKCDAIRMPIIAKIELPAAVANIDSILEAADGIMVARGDLGVEMDLARVPVIQKKLLAAAHDYGKPCVVATQMLQSMIDSTTPTRAEASDVANAIFDGTDAVMLSGETAVGRYPLLAVEAMRRIAEQAEAHLASLPARPSPPQKLVESRYRTAALAHGAWIVAQDVAARFIVVWSQLGGGARYLSQNDFTIPIIAITSDERAARQMQLLRSVTPIRMPVPESLAHLTQLIDIYLCEVGWAKEGDACVLMAGTPLGQSGATNRLAIHSIGDPGTGFADHPSVGEPT